MEKLKGTLAVLEMKKNSKLYITSSSKKMRDERLRKESPFGDFNTYNVRGYIVKYGDDMK